MQTEENNPANGPRTKTNNVLDIALPSFSVVSCCYNQGQYLADNIESVMRQDHPALEHIVVDDGSTDNTREVCARYPHVKYIYQKNAGQSAALNAGFKIAQGDIIAWLNSDDYYTPGVFSAAARVLSSSDARTIAHGHSQAVDEQGKVCWPMLSSEVEHFRLLFHPNLYKWHGKTCMPCQPSAFFRHSLLDELGILDVSLRYTMDYDLWLRALAHGYKFHLINLILSNYRFHATSHSTQGFDSFVPEWKLVSKRHLRALPPIQRARALLWLLHARHESRKLRGKNRLGLALNGDNPVSKFLDPPSVGSIPKDQELPKVSVVMPAYNVDAFVQNAIDSVLAQTHENWELLIVDDGSSDDTIAIVEKAVVAHPGRIRFFRHPDNGNHGVAATRNLALKQARGKLIAFLDPDDAWEPEKLERQAAFMLKHPSVKLSYTRAEIVRTTENDSFLPGAVDYGDRPPNEINPAALHVLIGYLRYAFSSVMVWRDTVEDVGGFTENLPFQNEDRIWVAQIAATCPIALLNETLCKYTVHAQSYTYESCSSGIVPLLFLDVQCRVLQWLKCRRINQELANQIAELLIPPSFKASLVWSKISSQHRDNVWRHFCWFIRRHPMMGMNMLWNYIAVTASRILKNSIDRWRPDYEMNFAVASMRAFLQKQRIDKIYLYGAGKHTLRLLTHASFAPIKIEAVLDDMSQEASVKGVPIINPAQMSLREKQEAVVVVSSDTSQQRLFRIARRNGFKHVHKLYRF